MTGDDDQRNAWIDPLDMLQKAHSIHAWHAKIGNYDARKTPAEMGERRLSVTFGDDREPFQRQRFAESLKDIGLVVDQQYEVIRQHEFPDASRLWLQSVQCAASRRRPHRHCGDF